MIDLLLKEQRDYTDYTHLDRADEVLAKYTHDPGNYISNNIAMELLERYPYKGGTIYRGMNFDTKEEYEDFMAATNNGTKLVTESISSWTRDTVTAKQFAVTRPTYQLNFALMSAEGEKSRTGDWMIGYAGVILKTTVGENVGIDVNASDFGKEDEVILPAGEYDIVISQLLQPFKHTVDSSNFKEQFMQVKSVGNEDDIDTKLFHYIIRNYKEFDEEMANHLGDLILALGKDTRGEVHVDKTRKVHSDEKTTEVNIVARIPYMWLSLYDRLPQKHQAHIKKEVNKVGKEIDKELEQVYNKIKDDDDDLEINFYGASDIMLNKFYDSTPLRKIKGINVNRYHKMNSKENITRINNLRGDEQRAEIDKMVKDLKALFANI